jgi:hypothetical protein
MYLSLDLRGVSMNSYRIAWRFACWSLGLVGVVAAFAVSIPAMVALFIGAGLVAGLSALNFAVRRHVPKPPPRDLAGFVATWCFVGGAACVAVVGLTALVGALAFLVLVFITVASPHAMGMYARGLRSSAGDLDDRQREDAIGAGHSPTTETGQPGRPPTTDLRSLTDIDLCHAWRASFSALQETSSPAQRLRVVQARQECLDEFERRNPEGLMSWLASGARAAANPSRYVLGSPSPRHRRIDWDDLIPRQDR